MVKIINVEDKLINLKWIDEFHLLAITVKEEFLLIDIIKGSIFTKYDFSDVNLIYNTSDFKV